MKLCCLFLVIAISACNEKPSNAVCRYSAGKHFSGAVFKNAFEITGVTGRSAILIHAGNSGGDTLGCFLPGNTVGATQVFGSAPARDSLYNLIRQYNAPKIKVMENEN